MHQNQPGLYTTNSLSSHASLLLSASPTIITSPLQNNTNNPQNPSLPPSIALARRQPSTPLLAASNVDNDRRANNDNSLNNSSNEGYINFKKPQNEIFKKLDGKIQKIVAAHSNLNKLYALNDFSSLGAGPKRPFELPPQLPPPPPWIPKVSGEYGNQWDEDPVSPRSTGTSIPNVEIYPVKPNLSILDPKSRMRAPVKQNTAGSSNLLIMTKAPSLTLDSAISKLHQRRQQQQQQQQQQQRQQQLQSNPKINSNQNLNSCKVNNAPVACSSSSTSNPPAPTMTPAQFAMLTQKIKETFDSERAKKTQKGSLSEQDKKKFKQDLIALLKKEIYDVTKSTSIKFKPTCPSPESRPMASEQRSLLLKSSPQTLFNTIHRETSILLNKRQHQVGRSSLSLLSDQQNFNRQNAHVNHSIFNRQQINRPHTIRVVVPPTELYGGLKFSNYLEKEAPQPTNDMISIEQFAKCLNLVRSNDASLQKHQEQLLQSETKWRMHLGTRPLRLRRIRGERIRMPASASYKATRKAGLQ